jgi:hypothetical protein
MHGREPGICLHLHDTGLFLLPLPHGKKPGKDRKRIFCYSGQKKSFCGNGCEWHFGCTDSTITRRRDKEAEGGQKEGNMSQDFSHSPIRFLVLAGDQPRENHEDATIRLMIERERRRYKPPEPSKIILTGGRP